MPTKGPGIWKFNNTLLNEQDFVAEMDVCIPNWIQEAESDLPHDTGSQWSFVKHKIGGIRS